MNCSDQLINKLYDGHFKKRRSILLSKMDELANKNVSCHSCIGTCCTFAANSMRITPIEALDLYFYLVKNDRWNQELRIHLEKNISMFRLDNNTAMGKASLRRTYTCPFYGHTTLGCSIDRENKPYGCLGFNAKDENELSGDSCRSDLHALEARELSNQDEDKLNEKIIRDLNLFWKKESISVALLDFFKLGL